MVDLRNPDAVMLEVQRILNDFRLKDKKVKINKLIDMYFDKVDEDSEKANELMAQIQEEREER